MIRAAVAALIALLILAILLDRVGVFGYTGDDWSRYDHARGTVQRVLAADLLEIRFDNRQRDTLVRLLGVRAPDPDDIELAQYARRQVSQRVLGQNVFLRLENMRTRAQDGRLLAYVYLDDDWMLNLELVRDGYAFADGSINHSFRAQFAQAEKESQRRARGLWVHRKRDDLR